jgi:hypothetical protein
VPGRAKGFGSQCHNSTLWDHALAPRVALKRRGSGLRVATPGMIARRVRRPRFWCQLGLRLPGTRAHPAALEY